MFENVRIRPEAELDLQDAYSYFEQCKFGLGTQFMECVENALAKVSSNYEHYPDLWKNVTKRLCKALYVKQGICLSNQLYPIFKALASNRLC